MQVERTRQTRETSPLVEPDGVMQERRCRQAHLPGTSVDGKSRDGVEKRRCDAGTAGPWRHGHAAHIDFLTLPNRSDGANRCPINARDPCRPFGQSRGNFGGGGRGGTESARRVERLELAKRVEQDCGHRVRVFRRRQSNHRSHAGQVLAEVSSASTTSISAAMMVCAILG